MKLDTAFYHTNIFWPTSRFTVPCTIPDLSDAVIYHVNTLWLFTKSDFMTTMIPISLFAIVAAPMTSIHNIPHLVFWLWFHLLSFNTSNQTASLEDETNKPDRPLPAGRITLRDAIILRWTLMPVCWVLSLAYSREAMFASMALSVFTMMYNELRGSGAHFMFRYALNGLGFAAFEAGTTLVAKNDKSCLDNAGWLAIFLSASIFATTIFAQDFRDVVGDSLINRDTIPLRFGSPSRTALLLGVIGWSIGLSCIWEVDPYSAVTFTALGTYAGGRFVKYTTVEEDRNSYFYYNIWVSVAHILPGYWRLFRTA
ncbi:UbiA prenyltransferase family-domain-containing protein [Mycena albidolilacea]|uniref:UbiA prenyltransferase family-domain-containing protein n=1 Tax=Mycena albidolilacea TaxID=1033008 RepID=A0AAD6ZEU4_9AGAR|nr:UbiA prenyltransferase family-domain-containing protein [Mycena albidolilacea]